MAALQYSPCFCLNGWRTQGLAAGLYHCNYTCEDLLFVEVCSDPTPVHCNTVQGNMLSPLLSAALQDRLAAG